MKGERMKRQTLFTITLLVIAVMVLVGVSNVQAGGVVTTDAIAGTWSGNMHVSDRNAVERTKLIILAGCEPGSACGTLQNYPALCTWEITYDGFSGGAYQYHFSKILAGPCGQGSKGSLTLLPDGSLSLVHEAPFFTFSGILIQLPRVGN
jgi:hypothetical protein